MKILSIVPVYPHRRARIVGINTAADEISVNRSEHSHTSKYILSPLADILLCKAMRLIPTDRGKYLDKRMQKKQSTDGNLFEKKKYKFIF